MKRVLGQTTPDGPLEKSLKDLMDQKVDRAGDVISGDLELREDLTIQGAINASNGLTIQGTGKVVAKASGDLTVARQGGTVGQINLNEAETRFLGFDGTKYNMPGANLNVGGALVAAAEAYANGGTRLARSNEALASMGATQAHYENGGNIPGQKALATRVDGYQYWIYYSFSTNCDCNCNCNCSCVPAGTMVETAEGPKKIEDVIEHEWILTSQDREYVQKLWRPLLGDRKLWSINGILQITGDHLIRTSNGWACVEPESYEKRRAAGLAPEATVLQLEIGREILTTDGWKKVESIEDVGAPPETQLYSLYVTGDAEFFANGIVVDGMNTPEREK